MVWSPGTILPSIRRLKSLIGLPLPDGWTFLPLSLYSTVYHDFGPRAISTFSKTGGLDAGGGGDIADDGASDLRRDGMMEIDTQALTTCEVAADGGAVSLGFVDSSGKPA